MVQSQQFYYEWNESNKLIMYLVDTQEKVYFVIPDRFEELYRNFYACQLGSFVTLDNIIDRYDLKLVEFENYLK